MTDTARLTSYICVDDARQAMSFYREVFSAETQFQLDQPDGRVGHAELKLGNDTLMISDEFPEINVLSPKQLGGTATALHLEIPDVDRVIERAINRGATLERPPEDQFYGMRSGTIIDPFGHRWMISTQIEDVSIDEMQRRFKETSGHTSNPS